MNLRIWIKFQNPFIKYKLRDFLRSLSDFHNKEYQNLGGFKTQWFDSTLRAQVWTILYGGGSRTQLVSLIKGNLCCLHIHSLVYMIWSKNLRVIHNTLHCLQHFGFFPIGITNLWVGLNVDRKLSRGILSNHHCHQLFLHCSWKYWFIGSKISDTSSQSY